MNNEFFILGNKLHSFTGYEALYQYLLSLNDRSVSKGYVTVNNVHTMMEGYWDASYQQIINSGFLSIPDGKPLEIVGKLKGTKDVSRLFGPSIMEKFINWGQKDNLSHFFFGSSDENLQKLRCAILAKYPHTHIAGMIAPPYAPADKWNNESFIETINRAKPDFIWIGLGAPKQERWMFTHGDKVERGIMFGIGAGFDYLAGNTRHAPEWMKNYSLEWLYRLKQEPGRLWKRYFTTIPPFLFFVSLELLGIKWKK